jgi:ectoine hydroxylase-related dioxygenase (phytanoyl-CoA dioxygenase family)
MGKRLTDEQIAFYQREGYLLAPGAVPEDALRIARAVLERWADQTIEGCVRQGLIRDRRADLDFWRRLARVWNDAGRPHYVRSPRRDLVSPDMHRFLAHPALLDLAEDLLGTPEVSVHGIFNARPKLPDQNWTTTPWHQDAQYYRDAEKAHVLSIWMPLQRVTERNSCLQVAAGWRQNVLYAGVDDPDSGFLGLSREDRASLAGASMEMDAGDALCFNQLMPHRALGNDTDMVRWSMDLRYEATPRATESGRKQGFVARSANPSAVESYEQWLPKWAAIPPGHY